MIQRIPVTTLTDTPADIAEQATRVGLALYYVARDADGEPTVWRQEPGVPADRVMPVLRQVDLASTPDRRDQDWRMLTASFLHLASPDVT